MSRVRGVHHREARLEPGERLTAPQCQRQAVLLEGAFRRVLGQLASVGNETLETGEVELVGLDDRAVPGPAGLDQLAAAQRFGCRRERAAEIRHVHLQGGRRAIAGIFTPQQLDEPLGGNDAAGFTQQCAENGLLFRAAQRYPRSADEHFQRTEDAELDRGAHCFGPARRCENTSGSVDRQIT